MKKRTTKTENFTKIMEILEELGHEELVKVMKHEIELIQNKKSKAKLSKTQEANEDIKKVMLKVLEDSDKALSITEMLTASEELNSLVGGSNQKASALMTQLKKAQIVIREQEGKKATFRLATEEDFMETEEEELEEIAE